MFFRSKYYTQGEYDSLVQDDDSRGGTVRTTHVWIDASGRVGRRNYEGRDACSRRWSEVSRVYVELVDVTSLQLAATHLDLREGLRIQTTLLHSLMQRRCLASVPKSGQSNLHT